MPTKLKMKVKTKQGKMKVKVKSDGEAPLLGAPEFRALLSAAPAGSDRLLPHRSGAAGVEPANPPEGA